MDFETYVDNGVTMGSHYTGKTSYVAKALIRPRIKLFNLWIWDFHGKITEYINPPSYMIKHQLKELEYGTQFFLPLDKSPKGYDLFLDKALSHKNLEVITDEAHNYSSAHRLTGNHAELIRNAQNYGVSYMEIFQRPQRVNGDVLENARHRFCFALDDTNSVKKMREWIGVEIEFHISPYNRSPQAKLNLPHLEQSIIHTSEQARQYFESTNMLAKYSYVYRDKQQMKPEVFNGGLTIE